MTNTLTVSVTEDAANGDAQFLVSVDGKQLGGVNTATKPHGGPAQAFNFPGTWGPGNHSIAITFSNDFWDAVKGTDRNLYVEVVGIDGSMAGGVPLGMFSAGTSVFTVTMPSVADTGTGAAITALQFLTGGLRTDVTGLQTDLAAETVARIKGDAGTVPPVVIQPPTPGPLTDPTIGMTSWSTLTVNPSHNIQLALNKAAKGFVLTMTPGDYLQVAHVNAGLDGWRVAGAGGAGQTRMSGQGGLTVAQNKTGVGATRLAWGKGVLHCGSAGTIEGLEVMLGGTNADDGHDLQAGIYWEASEGTGIVRKCMIRRNQNGIAANNENVRFNIKVDSCDFVDNSVDEGSHSMYVSGSADSTLTILNCTDLTGSLKGNNFKCRMGIVNIVGGYNRSRNGRWLDVSDGGIVNITGGVYVGGDVSKNVFANGDESTTKGPGNTTWRDSLIWLGGRSQDFWNAGSMQMSGITLQAKDGGSSAYNSLGGAMNGLPGAPTIAPMPASPGYVSGAT